MKTYLSDYSFLQNFIGFPLAEQYVKIIVLNWLEKPLQEIQGVVTGGSLSLNGKSAIRRTGNISLVTEGEESRVAELKSLFSINKKIKIEIGLLNTSQDYLEEDILWFPLGVYVISNPSISHNVKNINLSLSLKDKMALLNGDCGGTIPAPVTFHEIENLDPETGEYIIQKPTIIQIIRELVNHWGGEQVGKIIISDLDTRVKQVMKWTGSSPLYYWSKKQQAEADTNMFTLTATSPWEEDLTPVVYESGQDVGYINVDFTYPGELNGNSGDSVCTILDKIKNTLGNFEYYYDIHGNFIFQEIKNYLNTSEATSILNNIDYIADKGKGNISFTFDKSNIITSFSNNPQFNMIKNDFVVWGSRETASGEKKPIRFHLAIDEKPKIGNTYKCFFYADKYDKIRKARTLIEVNELPSIKEVDRYYLLDNTIYTWDVELGEYIQINEEIKTITTTDWRTELYLSGAAYNKYGLDSNYYYSELANEWPKIYDIEKGEFYPEYQATPSDMDFFLDFIDSQAAISELSVSNIGRRTKVINDDKVNCMFEPTIPELYIIEQGDSTSITECSEKRQDWVQVESTIYSNLALGGSLNSAYYAIQDLLYQHTNYNESITVQSLPVYFLEPNIRISVKDNDTGIFGDYIINSISLPLTVNGTMSLSCTKALEKI